MVNERIQELYIETANETADGKEWAIGGLHNAEKFAELIIEECIAIVDNAERGGSNEIWDNAVKFIRRDLKFHFGVK